MDHRGPDRGPAALLDDLRRSGVEVVATGGRIRYRPINKVSAEQRAALTAHKPELLVLLAAEQAEAAEERRCIQLADGIDLKQPGRPWTLADAVAAVLRIFPGAKIEQQEAHRAAA